MWKSKKNEKRESLLSLSPVRPFSCCMQMPFVQFLQKMRCGDSHLPKSQHCGVAYGIFVALPEQLACHQLCSKPDNLIINMGNKHSPCTSAFAILSIYICRSSLLILLGKQRLWVLPAPIPQKKSVVNLFERNQLLHTDWGQTENEDT